MKRNPYRWPSLFPKGGHTMSTDQWIEAVAPLFLQVPLRERRKRVLPRLGAFDRRIMARLAESARAADRVQHAT